MRNYNIDQKERYEKKVTFINSEMRVQQVDSSPTGNGP